MAKNNHVDASRSPPSSLLFPAYSESEPLG